MAGAQAAGIAVKAAKVKAHTTPEDVEKGVITLVEYRGNDKAEHYAKKGAGAHGLDIRMSWEVYGLIKFASAAAWAARAHHSVFALSRELRDHGPIYCLRGNGFHPPTTATSPCATQDLG